MDHELLHRLREKGYADFECKNVVYGESVKEMTKPGEREFMGLFVELMGKEADVTLYSSDANTFPRAPLPTSMQYQLVAAFVGMNVLKLMRSGLGLDVGPSFLDHMRFPIWRPSMWRQEKAPKFFTFLGVAQPHVAGSPHPHDYARSSRYNNCVMIRETPNPELLACEDYEKHHEHGLQGLAELLTLSFIDIDTAQRTFRFYCIQGCSRLYRWAELQEPAVIRDIKNKVFVKGRIPRMQDFDSTLRKDWSEGLRPIIERAQHAILSNMPALAPLLPIKMSIAQLSSHCIIDIAPIMLAMFLDGRTGMSYGFLAFQLPTGPVEDCSEVRVLCTRSGCDKQNPHPNNDWTVLSFDRETFGLEMAAELKGVCSPSFDSWLIVSQAVANVTLAAKFKQAGRCRRFVDQVENQGMILAHFHGFIDRASLPHNVAFFGQDKAPLPCGSVEAAAVTVEGKNAIAERALAHPQDIDYLGDVHVEPDHGSVVSCGVDVLKDLIGPAMARYGLTNFETYKEKGTGAHTHKAGCCGSHAFHQWDPLKAAGTKGLPKQVEEAKAKEAAASPDTHSKKGGKAAAAGAGKGKPAASRRLLF